MNRRQAIIETIKQALPGLSLGVDGEPETVTVAPWQLDLYGAGELFGKHRYADGWVAVADIVMIYRVAFHSDDPVEYDDWMIMLRRSGHFMLDEGGPARRAPVELRTARMESGPRPWEWAVLVAIRDQLFEQRPLMPVAGIEVTGDVATTIDHQGGN